MVNIASRVPLPEIVLPVGAVLVSGNNSAGTPSSRVVYNFDSKSQSPAEKAELRCFKDGKMVFMI